MKQQSKRYRANKALVTKTSPYTLNEAISLVKKFKPAKFDESVEVAMELGIDTKKSDQMIRGAVSLPRGIGKEMRVIVFCKDDKVPAAKAAGAIAAGGEELANKIRTENWLDFDVAVATPDMMGVVGKLGKILGPQGKMPSPKSGTVTADFASAVKEFRAGKIEFRADAGGNLHAAVGKASFPPEFLKENIETFIDFIRGLRPAAAKGKFINSCTISTTMGPGVKIEVAN